MNGDLRGWRMALVPDTLINPPHPMRTALPNVLALLEASGYGILQLPAPGEHRLLLAVIADQLAEYLHHGYAVVAIGLHGEPGDGLHWRRLAPLLRHRGAPLPPRLILCPEVAPEFEAQRLAAFLSNYDLPIADQQRWRL